MFMSKKNKRKVALFIGLAFILTLIAYPLLYSPDSSVTTDEPAIPVQETTK